MAKVLKTVTAVIGTVDGKLKHFGKETVAKGEEIYFVLDGMPATIQVFIQGTNVADYMISQTNDRVAACTALTAEYLDRVAADITVDDDADIEENITAVSVFNKATSTDSIIVTWRY